jgi:hypothetical protein
VQRLRNIAGNSSISVTGEPRELSETKTMVDQQHVLDGIDENIDMTLRTRRSRRGFDCKLVLNSVVKPGSRPLPTEEDVSPDSTMDRNCDQVRLMIKHFVQTSEWTLDQFRFALGDVARPALNTFLEESGSGQGRNSRVYQLAWMFFNKREKLGLSWTNSDSDRVAALQRKAGTARESKRRIGDVEEGDNESSRKHIKVTEFEE